MDKYKVNVPEGQSGKWHIEKFEILENDSKALSYALHGRPIPPGVYTRLMEDGAYDPMMSDTPAEIRDHLDFIYEAHGNCLVNGLGLGVVLKALLDKPEVKHVDVVELEQDIINLVWPTYKDGNRVTLYHANAFTIQWAKDKHWDCIWHDIWPAICSDYLPEITKLKRKYGRKCTYQAAWAEHEMRYYRRYGY